MDFSIFSTVKVPCVLLFECALGSKKINTLYACFLRRTSASLIYSVTFSPDTEVLERNSPVMFELD